MPAARALSSPSGKAAEDNVVEREKIFGQAELRTVTFGSITLCYVPDGQTDVEVEIVL